MIEGKTRSGFKFKVDERVTEDWRLISNITLAESEDLTDRVKGITEIVHLLLGDNEKALIEHVKKKNQGFVPIDAITTELASIITAVNEKKNLPSSHT